MCLYTKGCEIGYVHACTLKAVRLAVYVLVVLYTKGCETGYVHACTLKAVRLAVYVIVH